MKKFLILLFLLCSFAVTSHAQTILQPDFTVPVTPTPGNGAGDIPDIPAYINQAQTYYNIGSYYGAECPNQRNNVLRLEQLNNTQPAAAAAHFYDAEIARADASFENCIAEAESDGYVPNDQIMAITATPNKYSLNGPKEPLTISILFAGAPFSYCSVHLSSSDESKVDFTDAGNDHVNISNWYNLGHAENTLDQDFQIAIHKSAFGTDQTVYIYAEATGDNCSGIVSVPVTFVHSGAPIIYVTPREVISQKTATITVTVPNYFTEPNVFFTSACIDDGYLNGVQSNHWYAMQLNTANGTGFLRISTLAIFPLSTAHGCSIFAHFQDTNQTFPTSFEILGPGFTNNGNQPFLGTQSPGQFPIETAPPMLQYPFTDYSHAFLISSEYSGKVLDADTNTINSNGTYVQQWDYLGNWNQIWRIVPTDEPGFYNIVNGQSGRCLDLSYGSINNGTQIWLYDCNGGVNQKWAFFQADDTSWYITSKVTGKVADVAGPTTNNGAELHEWDDLGNSNQRFWIGQLW